jgi:hypothetical protein
VLHRRAALHTGLNAAAAAAAVAAAAGDGEAAPARPTEQHLGIAAGANAPPRVALAWRALRRRILAGPPNLRVGLVQGQQIFDHAEGVQLLGGGLVRVRIPNRLIPQGDDAWHPHRFPDARRMEQLRALGLPFKAVIELPVLEKAPDFRFSDAQQAAHAARLVTRYRPDVVIVGNEVNVVDRREGVDLQAVVDRYLDRYDIIQAVVRATSPGTLIQLYGEAYFGQPIDPDALLRRVLHGMRQRGLAPPDIAGIHVYDHAGPIPARVRDYRRLLADFGLHIHLSVEEMGPRMGVIDREEVGALARTAPDDPDRFPSRLDEMRGAGWISEAEQAHLVAQHLATAAAVAEQAQVFCASDFTGELKWRRGLISLECGRARPALAAFRFMQRLLAGAEVRLSPSQENAGVVEASVTRADGITARVVWAVPRTGTGALDRPSLLVPSHSYVCDALGQLVHLADAIPRTVPLPPAATGECGGAVRVLIRAA